MEGYLAFALAVIAIKFARDMARQRHDLRTQELALRTVAPQTTPTLTDDQAKALRTEMEQLRDTTTSYCMSLQHTIDTLEQRVNHLESRLSDPSAPVQTPSPIQQTVGRST